MIALLTLALAWGGGAIGALPPADHLETQVTAMAGSGASQSGAGGTTLVRPSPMFVTAEVGFRHPGLPWLEFAPTVLLEIQGRVGVAANPKIRAYLRLAGVELFALAGVPVFVAPYSLLGIQVGAGFAIPIHRHFGLVGEASANAFVWGSDLMKDSILAKFDGSLGIRVSF